MLGIHFAYTQRFSMLQALYLYVVWDSFRLRTRNTTVLLGVFRGTLAYIKFAS